MLVVRRSLFLRINNEQRTTNNEHCIRFIRKWVYGKLICVFYFYADLFYPGGQTCLLNFAVVASKSLSEDAGKGEIFYDKQ